MTDKQIDDYFDKYDPDMDRGHAIILCIITFIIGIVAGFCLGTF